MDCQKPTVARGLCRMHYNRWRRTGDPTGLRRPPAPTVACAREGCAETVKTHKGRPRRYCSLDCYRADASNRVHAMRTCAHCSESYKPSGSSQRFCSTCLGPPIQTSHGLRYQGATRLRLYGVSHPEWLAMVARHDGKCWICRTNAATALDHCHATNRVRGALCDPCNTRLHVLEEAGWLDAAQSYLTAREEVSPR